MKHLFAIGLIFFISIVSVILSPHIGVSWDEPDNIWAAGVYTMFFKSGMNPLVLTDKNSSASYFHQKIFTQEPSLHRYPPFPLYIGNMVIAIRERFEGNMTAPQIISSFHIASGLFLALLSVSLFYFIYFITRSFLVSTCGALLIVLHPTLFGYGLSIIKDSAQVSLFSTTLLLLVASTLRRQMGLFILGSVLWGIAMATKMNAVYIPLVWFLWRGIMLIFTGVLKRKDIIKPFLFLVRDLFVLTVIGTIVMIVVWPYLWFDPIGRFREVFSYFTTVGTGYKVFWNGVVYMTGVGTPFPWYPLAHILIGMPLPFIVFLGVSFRSFFHGVLKRDSSRLSWFVLMWLWIALPLVRSFSPGSAFYDGMRHFIEVLPPILILSIIGISDLSRVITSKLPMNINFLALVLAGVIVHQCMILVSFFPYSYGYANAMIGQRDSIVERDYAAMSVVAAVKQVQKDRPNGSNIFIPIGGHLSWYYLGVNDAYVYYPTDADVLILINKPSHIIKSVFDAQVSSLYTVKDTVYRGNIPFAWIYVKR